MSSVKDIIFPKLNDQNYLEWRSNMQALLMTKGYWSIVNGTSPLPTTAAEQPAWYEKHDAAAGLLWLALEPSQQAMVRDKLGEAINTWDALHDLHATPTAPARFNAYD